jgi:hypothetical protein
MADNKGLQWYRHFKGGIYLVVDEATHSETGEVLVIYRTQDRTKTWARPREMFYGEKDGKPQFERVLPCYYCDGGGSSCEYCHGTGWEPMK